MRLASTGYWAWTAAALLVGAAGAAERKEVVLDAVDLAPAEVRSDEPAAGKWWLNRQAADWGASGGAILMTGMPSGKAGGEKLHQVAPVDSFTAQRVPPLVIDPQVKGWHRIYVELFHQGDEPQDQLLARLSREPYPEYLQTPRKADRRVVEVYWKAADLTDQKIHMEQSPGPMPHPLSGYFGGVARLRLVPMSDDEVAAANQEIEPPPPAQRLFGMLDYTDEVFWWNSASTPEEMRAIVYRHAQAGFGRIYWRCFGTHLENSLALEEAAPRWTAENDAAWCQRQGSKTGWVPYLDMTEKFDPFRVAVEYGDKVGCEVHAWVRFTNFNREPFANFWHDHPEFSAQMLKTEKDPKTGLPVPVTPYERYPFRRVLSFAYPEVRSFYVRFFKHITASGTRGIMIDLLRHPPIAGYEPIVAAAFKEKYGMDMETRDVFHDPLVQEHLSGYLKAFLVELRQELGPDIEISVRCSGPEKFALRGREWIDAGLIDTIIDGNWYSGNAPRPTIDATVTAAGTRGRAMAIAEVSDVDPDNNWARREGTLSPESILALARAYSGRGVARFGLYESTIYTWSPDRRRAIRRAGWEYEPTKKAP